MIESIWNRVRGEIHRGRVGIAILFAALVFAPGVHAQGSSLPKGVELRLPADIVYAHAGSPDSDVVFRHDTHVDLEGNKCTGCHLKLYRILEPTHHITHKVMNAGGSCGACHDGKHAFDVRANESCTSCHAGRKPHKAAGDSAGGGSSAPASFKGPAPFGFKPSSDSPGQVTFRHGTHLGNGLTCKSCHPKPFAMKGTAPLANGEMHSARACGMCHDGKKSFSTENDDKCDKCHAEGKGAK